MTAYLYGPPNGVVGSISRPGDETVVEQAMLVNVGGAGYIQAYGAPVKYATNNTTNVTGITAIVAGDTAASFVGIVARSVPSAGGPSAILGASTQNFASAIPNPEQPQDLLKRGYISVACTIGTPVRNGTVYMRVVAATGKNIGDFEATADGANNVALASSQAVWAVDGKDQNGVGEIRIGYSV